MYLYLMPSAHINNDHTACNIYKAVEHVEIWFLMKKELSKQKQLLKKLSIN